MEAVIGIGVEAGLKAVKALTALIQEAQDVPDLVADIRDTAHHFHAILDASNELLKVRYPNIKQCGDMLSGQKTCMKHLKAIAEILQRYFNTKPGWSRMADNMIFVIGPKKDLVSHLEDLTRHIGYFGTLIEQLRANAPKRTISPPVLQTQRPVMSIDQYAYINSTASNNTSGE